jgi:dipeptide/tripeptide permease
MFKSFPDAPPGIAVSGAEVSKVLEWDAEARLLTAKEEIKERARVEFLASAADPEFKKAVDELYLTSADYRVSIWWLIAFYMILTMGELCLSPVGLSLVTKLAPPRHVGLLMGGWFLATAAAEKAAHTLGAYWGQMPPMTFFTIFVVLAVVAALILGILVRPLKKMMHGVN